MMPDRHTLPNATNLRTDNLRIWQQNCRKSPYTQACLTSSLSPDNYNLCLIQEPYIDPQNHTTRSAIGWTVIYPPTHFLDRLKRTRSVILVSPRVGSNICTAIPIISADITAVQIETPLGAIHIFNIYNDQHNDNATDRLRAWRQDPKGNTLLPTLTYSQGGPTHTIWAGDFNRHHQMWDENHQEGLFTPRAIADAEKLIESVTEAGLEMAMPKDMNTLRTSAGNWTQPDNVFMSPELLKQVVQCMPDAGRMPAKTDHLAIFITIDVNVDWLEDVESYLWKNVESAAFRKELRVELAEIDPQRKIDTIDQIKRATLLLSKAIERVVKRLVKTVCICRHTRWWWIPELTKMRDKVRHLKLLTFVRRDDKDDLVHKEWKTATTQYKRAIDEQKREHWRMFIENAREWDVYLVHKMVTGTGSDGGRTRLPALISGTDGQGQPTFATTNKEKSRTLHAEFFPPPANDEQPLDMPDNFPPEVKPFHEFMEEQVRQAIKHMKPWKAVMKDDQPNAVLTWCADNLIPHLTPIYNALIRLSHYPSNWKHYDTIVLQKPGKSDYTKPNAY
jgi:hypothetical protein